MQYKYAKSHHSEKELKDFVIMTKDFMARKRIKIIDMARLAEMKRADSISRVLNLSRSPNRELLNQMAMSLGKSWLKKAYKKLYPEVFM